MNAESRKSNIGTAERWLSLALGTEFLYHSIKKRNLTSIPAAVIGGGLIYRGAKNYCPVYRALGVDRRSHSQGPDAAVTVVVAKPAAELYRFWRDFRNAPRFMSHVSKVDVIDDTHSKWTMTLPGGHTFQWTCEVTEDLPDSGFQWKSGEASPINVNGSIRFKDAAAGRGTQVIASIRFSRSGGGLLGHLARPLATNTVHNDLLRFKRLMETGEVPTTKGQPSGRVWADRALVARGVSA